MWKLLPACVLVACAAPDQQQTGRADDAAAEGRIVRQLVLPLATALQPVAGQPRRTSFRRTGTQGWLDENGRWHFETEIHHSRLRCGTYQAGLQWGSGSRDCADADWLTGVEYVTRLRHCNSASRLHAGDGVFNRGESRLQAINCVRVVVRCTGVC